MFIIMLLPPSERKMKLSFKVSAEAPGMFKGTESYLYLKWSSAKSII